MFKVDRCNGDYKRLYEMYNKAENILNIIGLIEIDVKRISLNNRLTRTLGWYISDTKCIEISTRHFMCSPDEEILNTIIHEISHNICENKFGEQEENGGHTKKWFEIAQFISDKTGYIIQPETSITEDLNVIVDIPQYYHIFKCKKCGYEYTAYSMYKEPLKIRKRKCICCLYEYKLHNKEYSEGDFKCIQSGISHYRHKYKRTKC